MAEVKVTAQSLEKRKKRLRIAKIVVFILFVILLVTFFVLSIIYKGGRFTVTLDPNFTNKSGIVLYETQNDINYKNKLYAKEIEFMDNISVDWIPKDINHEKDHCSDARSSAAGRYDRLRHQESR